MVYELDNINSLLVPQNEIINIDNSSTGNIFIFGTIIVLLILFYFSLKEKKT